MKKVVKRKKHVPVCPYCGSKDIAKYLYGLHPLTNKIMFSGKFALGGCVITEDVSPKYSCNDCGKDFGIYMKSKKGKSEAQ